jgi:hypothetical protein
VAAGVGLAELVELAAEAGVAVSEAASAKAAKINACATRRAVVGVRDMCERARWSGGMTWPPCSYAAIAPSRRRDRLDERRLPAARQ